MNKQDIFPLYVGKCKVRTGNGIKSYWACDLGTQMIEHTQSSKHGDASNVSDCQLILKRISDMSEEHKQILWQLGETYHFQGITKVDNEPYGITLTTERTLWLIQNGYALNDEWFANGIAVEEKTK